MYFSAVVGVTLCASLLWLVWLSVLLCCGWCDLVCFSAVVGVA